MAGKLLYLHVLYKCFTSNSNYVYGGAVKQARIYAHGRGLRLCRGITQTVSHDGNRIASKDLLIPNL